jgi:hypothetical protein
LVVEIPPRGGNPDTDCSLFSRAVS